MRRRRRRRRRPRRGGEEEVEERRSRKRRRMTREEGGGGGEGKVGERGEGKEEEERGGTHSHQLTRGEGKEEEDYCSIHSTLPIFLITWLHMMSKLTIVTRLARQISQLTLNRTSIHTCSYSTDVRRAISNRGDAETIGSFGDQFVYKSFSSLAGKPIGGECKPQVGENVSRKDKISFLVNTLLDLKDSKEAVYGALDAWVAWERNFPIGSLKQVLLKLEKEQQWHRIVQVIKWMLSKGQGNTMGTYEQLIKALDMDHRAKEAHEFWNKKIGSDLHSVPWRLCSLMISVYYRNHMLEDLIKLFKGLEAFDRKPPDKSIVQKVADTYEVLGFLDQKDHLLEKYKDLFTETWNGSPKGLRGSRPQRKDKQARVD